MNAHKVYIVFSRPRKRFAWFSWLIRAVEGTKYSHVSLAWVVPNASVKIVVEAGGQKVRFFNYDLWSARNETVHELPMFVTKKEFAALQRWALTLVGTDYGVLQLLGIGLVRLFGLRKNPFANGRKSQVCAELVGQFLQDIIKWDITIDLEIAGPKDIYQIFKKEA